MSGKPRAAARVRRSLAEAVAFGRSFPLRPIVAEADLFSLKVALRVDDLINPGERRQRGATPPPLRRFRRTRAARVVRGLATSGRSKVAA